MTQNRNTRKTTHSGFKQGIMATLFYAKTTANQTRQQRLTLACRNPYALLPYACTCIKRGRKTNTRMQEPPMPPSLGLYMYQTRQERITFACRNPLCLLPYAFTCIKRGSAKANTRMQEPPMPPYLRLYMYRTRQQDFNWRPAAPYASFLTLVQKI